MGQVPVRVFPPGYGHSPLSADYRPWESDYAFLAVWRTIREHTMLDLARLYELWELTEQALCVPGDILEVGTWRGGSATLIGARAAQLVADAEHPVARVRAGTTPRLWIADTFAGVAKAGSEDPYYRGGEHADTALDIVESLLHIHALQNFRILSGIFPEDTAQQVDSSAIALCHIDVDVYQSARDVMEWVWPRVPIGGIIVFDDYGFYGCEGVTKLIHEIRPLPDRIIVANVNGHAVVVKTQER
jgi:O-methyltransferase